LRNVRSPSLPVLPYSALATTAGVIGAWAGLHVATLFLPAPYGILLAAAALLLPVGIGRPHLPVYLVLVARVVIDLLWWLRPVAGFSLQQVMSGVLTVLMALFALVYVRRFERHPFLIPAIAMTAIAALHLPAYPDTAFRIEALIRVSSPLMLGLISAEFLNTPERRRTAVHLLALACGLAVTLANVDLAQGEFGAELDGYRRLWGPYQSFQNLAYASLIAATLGVFLFLEGRDRRWPRLVGALLAGAASLALYYTYSRTTALGLVLFGATLLAIRRRWKTLLALSFSLSIWVARSDTLQDRFDDVTIVAQAPDSEEALDAGSGRLALWNDNLTRYSGKSPYHQLLGSGVGTNLFESRQRVDTHNEFLIVLYEFGIIGLGMLLWSYALIVRTAHRLYTRSEDPWNRTFGEYMLAFMVAVVTCNALSNAFVVRPTPTWLFWGLAGLLFAAAADDPAVQRRSNVSSPPSPHTV
jgi:hypothetical protein